ncbi:MAG: hypothetical protein HBSAPP03_10810 [Phycisphaerae bacterium]|nr:MAG: hypothetical protein HBSAPP03_10810 [Phycisphaerae bacterium]
MSDAAPKPRKRFKWEPLALVVLVTALGLLIVYDPSPGVAPRPGAEVIAMRLGSIRGAVEVYRASDSSPPEFRLLQRDGHASPVMQAEEFRAVFGERAYDASVGASANWAFRLFNITSWWSLAWVAVGLGGQAAFSGRMLVQWIASERRRESIVPEAFWWMSLIGGVALFAYFGWRQDIVGVLGQSSGLVVYARNLRLIYKQRRRVQAEDQQKP